MMHEGTKGFKWVNMFKTGEEEWYKSKSRAPKKHGRKTGKEMESTVVNVRIALMEGNEHESKYLGVSADAIQYRMETLVFSREEIPAVSTIKFWDKETFTSLFEKKHKRWR